MSIFGTPNVVSTSNYPIQSIQSPTFNTSIGDLILVNFGCFALGVATMAATDAAGNTLTALPIRGSAGSLQDRWFYCLSATHASATNSVTCTTDTNTLGTVVVWNVPISGGNALLDFNTDLSAVSATPTTSPSYSATGSDEFIAAWAGDTSRISTFTAGAGFTLDAGTVGGSFPNAAGAEHQITASPGSSASFTFTGGSTSVATTAIGFKQAVAATQPTFSPDAGTYTQFQSVTIASASPGVSIHYTTDGSTPTAASPLYSSPITFGHNCTLKAFATGGGFGDSTVKSGAYVFTSTLPVLPAASVTDNFTPDANPWNPTNWTTTTGLSNLKALSGFADGITIGVSTGENNNAVLGNNCYVQVTVTSITGNGGLASIGLKTQADGTDLGFMEIIDAADGTGCVELTAGVVYNSGASENVFFDFTRAIVPSGKVWTLICLNNVWTSYIGGVLVNAPTTDSNLSGGFATIQGAYPVSVTDTQFSSFSAGSSQPAFYSVPDCRNYSIFPNGSVTIANTLQYTVQTSDNAAVPGTDSRASKPVDCRVASIIPTNCRQPGTFGPGE